MDEVLAWAIAAYMSNPDADDADVAELLTTSFPRGLANRAVAFLPLAFGRRVLDGLVGLSDTFIVDEREHPLAAEPMYARARQLADEADRAQIDRIGLRSAELVVVNKALHAGSDPADLELSPPVFLALEGPTDGAVTAAGMLAAFVAGHGSRLACEARVFPHKLTPTLAMGQIDIVVSAPALHGRRIVESFGSYGDTIAAAQKDALGRFAEGSLHALLATLDDRRHGGGQVEWEAWGDFQVCMGGVLRRWGAEPPVAFGPYIDEIKARLLAADLSREIHWFRTFVSVGKDGVDGHDALLDNEPWAPGVEAVTGWPWPRGEKPYALRHFFVLVPDVT